MLYPKLKKKKKKKERHFHILYFKEIVLVFPSTQPGISLLWLGSCSLLASVKGEGFVSTLVCTSTPETAGGV